VTTLSEWLALREPPDTTARSLGLTEAVIDMLPRDRATGILDLGTGTGSNVRYLARYLGTAQHWLLVDDDPALLAEIPVRVSSSVSAASGLVRVETRRLNLGTRDHPEIFSGRDLVTASALLDLVSESWLDWLATHCSANGAIALFALTYNGRSFCSPPEPEDDTIRDLMNHHQKTNDKGFGPAAGPDAVRCAERSFTAVGYRVRSEPSDWTLTPDMRDLQRLLIEGWADASREMTPERAAMIDDWLARRLAHVDAGRSRIIVCHDDIAAWPSPC